MIVIKKTTPLTASNDPAPIFKNKAAWIPSRAEKSHEKAFRLLISFDDMPELYKNLVLVVKLILKDKTFLSELYFFLDFNKIYI